MFELEVDDHDTNVENIVSFLDNYIRNDDGVLVRYSMDLNEDEDEDGEIYEYDNYLYCGRRLGRDVIPVRDGRCGPTEGPPCPSCLRLIRGPKRLDILTRTFPTVPQSVMMLAVRESGGSVFNTIRYLLKLNAPKLPFAYGFAPPAEFMENEEGNNDEGEEDVENNNNNQVDGEEGGEDAALNEQENGEGEAPEGDGGGGGPERGAARGGGGGGGGRGRGGRGGFGGGGVDEVDMLEMELIRALALDTLPQGRAMAQEALARHNGDIEGAVAWLLDDAEAVARAVADRQKKQTHKKSFDSKGQWEEERQCAIEVLLQQSLPESIVDIAKALRKQAATRKEDIFVVDNHRMVRVTTPETTCVVCCNTAMINDDKLPGSNSHGSFSSRMSHICELCELCDVCVRSKVVHSCAKLPNGGAVHHHPLSFDLSRTHHCCNPAFEDCLDDVITWCCMRCDFDICPKCIAQKPPNNYCRVKGQVIEKSERNSATNDDEDDDVDDEEDNDDDDDDDDEEDNDDDNNNGEEADIMDTIPELRELLQDVDDDDDDDDDAEEENDRIVPLEPIQRRPQPTLNGGVDHGDVTETEVDESESAFGGQAFDERAAERVAAARWEQTYNETSVGDVVVGTGAVGTTTLPREPTTTAAPGDAVNPNQSALYNPSDTNLSTEARMALEMYQSKYGAGDLQKNAKKSAMKYGEVDVAAAADITHVENLLHRANAVGGDALMSRALNQAVAAGRLEIAGTLLLSQIFAPKPEDGPQCTVIGPANGGIGGLSSGETKRELMRCWCGELIDSETSPDGAVGCLSGHAMHPSCAADLLLGGGLCPTCRQPLFFPQVPRREAESALKLAKAEMVQSREHEMEKMRLEKEELAAKGLRVSLNVGDVVRISDDVEACKKRQTEDPRRGGWGNDMAAACGTEGRITKILLANNEPIAIQVTKQLGHRFVRRKNEDFYCQFCHNWDESVLRKCSRCERCSQCCRRSPDRGCPEGIQDYYWDPSLLELVWRASSIALWDELSSVDKEQAAVKAAEEHLVRLKAELRAVSAARAAVKNEMEQRSSMRSGTWDRLGSVSRKLSTMSRAAMGDIVGRVSPADWRRARHLLILARQWGHTEKAKAKRAKLYELVQDGEIDSAARIVRRYNATRIAEAAKWADAVAETGEYTVEPTAKVDLRAFPSNSAPRTGFALDPKFRFFSKREVLDRSGNMWLQVDETRCETFQAGDRVVSNIALHPARARSLIGLRVRRGEDWEHDDQDGGENNQGEITQVLNTGEVVVRWDNTGGGGGGEEEEEETYPYRAGQEGFHDLVFACASPPPPQGWLCVRPGGLGSPAIVRRSRGALRCFCCGDGLMHTKFGKEKFSSVMATKLKKDDQVFVAATLEPVQILSTSKEGHVYCSFASKPLNRDGENVEFTNDKIYSIWYRPEDLVVQKGTGNSEENNDLVCYEGQLRTRRELVLMCQGDELEARNAWKEAKNKTVAEEDDDIGFASCARGHLLHARCFQGALLAGRCCPAAGCTEPLWVPRVRRQTADDDECCGGGGDGGGEELEALKMANELVGHAALVSARAEEGVTAPTRDELTLAGLQELKMCPACCSGPLLNENCSNMQTHHGECSVSALRGGETECTPDGRFYVPASEIAERIMNMSPSKTVADVLPRCPKHNVVVMFNGCMACGHLFTDTSWNDLPAWDPKAKGMLELDKKKRRAADLLAKQIRTEAALLQFERDALWNTWGDEEMDDEPLGDFSSSSEVSWKPQPRRSVMTLNRLPPLPAPAEDYVFETCGPTCRLDHSDDGPCLLCGQGWHAHYGHNCQDGARGCWRIDSV